MSRKMLKREWWPILSFDQYIFMTPCKKYCVSWDSKDTDVVHVIPAHGDQCVWQPITASELSSLQQGLANIFCKRQERKYFRMCHHLVLDTKFSCVSVKKNDSSKHLNTWASHVLRNCVWVVKVNIHILNMYLKMLFFLLYSQPFKDIKVILN